MVFLLLGTPAFALTTSEAGKILENFKRQEKEMIFESDAKFLDESDTGILKTYRKLNIYNNIWESVRSKREYLEAQNEKVVNRINSLEESIKELNLDISNMVEEVANINAQVVDTKSKIEGNKQTISLLKKRIVESTDILMEYLVYLYKKWEFVSSWNDIDNFKSILLSGENIDDLVNDLYFKSIIQVTGKQLIDKHRKFVSQLYVKKLELEKDEENLKILRKQWILEKNILDDKRASKERLLVVTKWREDLYEKYIKEKLEVERDIKLKELREQIKLNNTKKQLLEKYGCEFIDLVTQETEFSTLSQECQNINRIIYAESRLSWVPAGNNPLDWPIPPYRWISSFYRDAEYKRQFWTNHDAIDVVAPQGTGIKAPMDGYVIFIQPPLNSWYAYVAIKHTDGLVTLYGHINTIDVELYEYVKKWQIFAETGWEYGTNGAWLLTTWPHLHFVVYENEEYVDPLEYLDISYLAYGWVPSRYEQKYLSDFRTRKWFEYTKTRTDSGNTFRIEWEWEVERQKFLLSTYAVGSFNNWDIWVEESVAWGVDPTFMMCVWLAETTLWKYLKTSYNIGNVWNTDSWSTYSFSNAREWIHWMTKTFNNQYLSQYSEIRELSRYGNANPDKPIYASSDFNWHNNIIKCMSHVKWKYVPDDYNFRINQN